MAIKIFNANGQVFVKENDKLLGNIQKLELILTIKENASRLYLTFADGKQRVCATDEITQIQLDSISKYSISKIDKTIIIKQDYRPLGLVQEAKLTQEINHIPILELKIAFLMDK